jgi:hypothetical protein
MRKFDLLALKARRIWLLVGLQVLQTGSLGAVPSHWLIATTGDYLNA